MVFLLVGYRTGGRFVLVIFVKLRCRHIAKDAVSFFCFIFIFWHEVCTALINVLINVGPG